MGRREKDAARKQTNVNKHKSSANHLEPPQPDPTRRGDKADGECLLRVFGELLTI